MGLSDHRRVVAAFIHADSDRTGSVLAAGLGALAEAAGDLPAPPRVAAEMITPYPPGSPAVVPGEVISRPVWTTCAAGWTRSGWWPGRDPGAGQRPG